jgi:4-hydroxy-tetrahydrodipicolinate synthase
MNATRLAERVEPAAGKIRGVWCPVLTPVDEELRPEPRRFVAHARWLLEQGCHGLGVFGTTGEANSFSVDERIELLEAAVSGGLPPQRLMVGTGCCALTDTVRLTRHALDLGISDILALPPFYYKGNSDEALFSSFDLVVQRLGTADFRLFLYHFPKLSGVPITPGLIERLRTAYPESVAGVKDSSGDWENTKLLIERFPELSIFPGAETYLLPALEIGGAGCITASANVNPAPIRAVFDAHAAGEGSARAKQQEIAEIRSLLQAHPMIPAMKFILADARDDQAWRRVRPPMLALADTEGRAMLGELRDHGWQLEA